VDFMAAVTDPAMEYIAFDQVEICQKRNSDTLLSGFSVDNLRWLDLVEENGACQTERDL
jgi:hypothetical protein